MGGRGLYEYCDVASEAAPGRRVLSYQHEPARARDESREHEVGIHRDFHYLESRSHES